MNHNKIESRKGDDWKQWKKGWQYKGINDPKYIEDKRKLFSKHGNGWGFFTMPRDIE